MPTNLVQIGWNFSPEDRHMRGNNVEEYVIKILIIQSFMLILDQKWANRWRKWQKDFCVKLAKLSIFKIFQKYFGHLCSPTSIWTKIEGHDAFCVSYFNISFRLEIYKRSYQTPEIELSISSKQTQTLIFRKKILVS